MQLLRTPDEAFDAVGDFRCRVPPPAAVEAGYDAPFPDESFREIVRFVAETPGARSPWGRIEP